MSATDAKIDNKPEAVEEPKVVEETKPVETVEKKAEETKEEAKPVVAVRPCRHALRGPFYSYTIKAYANLYLNDQSVVETATDAAATAASTVTAAATTMQDSDEDRGDNSGSAKAQKEAAAGENPEVR